MLLTNVEDIIHARTIENSRVEYKDDWNPQKIAHTICAFANDIENIGGGYIILGISEVDGQPVFPVKGINRDSIDSINKDLIRISNLIEPRYIPTTEHIVYDGKDLLVIEAVTGSNRPYKCPDIISSDKSKRTGSSYYIRRLSSTIVANSDDERELFKTSSSVPFDCRVNDRAKITDLKMWILDEYMSKVDPEECEDLKGQTPELVFRKMKVLGDPPYELHPINAGLMFFNERPDEFFEKAQIEVVNMPDPTGNGMTESVYRGPLDIQLERAIEHIRSSISTMIEKDPDTPVATRTYSYPLAAIEEALSNAVYHKDYSIPEPVTVTIRPDRIEILSLPGPDRSISNEDIASFNMSSTRYRNARIGDLLKHRGLAEKRGTGIPTMVKALRSNGSEDPVFETDSERSFFRVTIRINPKFSQPGAVSAGPAKRRTTEELRRDIMEALRDHGTITMKELTDILGYSRNARTVYAAVKNMVESGMIEYTIPDKMSSRNQRIRIRI